MGRGERGTWGPGKFCLLRGVTGQYVHFVQIHQVCHHDFCTFLSVCYTSKKALFKGGVRVYLLTTLKSLEIMQVRHGLIKDSSVSLAPCGLSLPPTEFQVEDNEICGIQSKEAAEVL